MNKSRQGGVTLVEILVALLVLAFGLIGLAGLQATAMTNNQVSFQYSQATMLAQNIAERMRANRDGVVANAYEFAAGVPGDPDVNCASSTCTSAEQAAWDLASWYASVAKLSTPYTNVPAGPSANLPSAKVSVVCAAASLSACEEDSQRLVTIYWNADRSANPSGLSCDSSNSSDLRCFRLAFVP